MNTILEQINSAGKFFVEFAVPMLAQSSVLIVILLLADLVLRKKVRAVFRYCIWMLVLVKLVLPSSLSSPMSVGYWFGDVVGSVKLSSPPASVNPVGGAEATEAGPMETASAAPVVTPKTGEAIVEPVASVTPVTWQGAVFLVWLAVVIAMGLLLLQRAIFVSGLVAQAKKANNLMNDALKFCCGTMKVNGKIGLKVSANAASPAVCGLFRPVILVPENLAPTLGAGHLRTVLLHELAHIKRGDLWVNLAQTILQIIYFYNPLLWLANCVIRRVREQAVDEAVQVAMGEKAKQYPETLVNVAKVAFKRPALSLRLIGVVESKSTLQARIKRMLNRPIPKTAKLGILGLIAVIIFGAVLLPMAGAMSGPPTFTVKGTVTDAETGKPIAGAKVGDVERYAGGKQWTTTDANGNYSYKTWYEEHAVKCEIAGYETQIKGFLPKLFGLDLEKERVVDFALEPEQSSDRIDYSSVTVKEGVGFDDIIVGDVKCTGEFIKSKLGQPDEETEQWLNYKEKLGLDFWFNKQNVLREVRLNRGFKGKLTSGISMSSTMKDVFDTYGKPISEKVVDDLTRHFENQVLYKRVDQGWLRKSEYNKIFYNQNWLLFWFEGERISQIVIYPKTNKTDVQVEGKEVSGITEVDIRPADFDIRLDDKRRTCNLVVSIQNKKNVNIPKFKLRFYRGNPENNLDEAGNVHTGWHEAGPIEPGKSWNERTRDFHLADGQYEFHAVLDYDDNVPEVDENNNQAVLKVTIKNGRIIEKSVSYSPQWNKKKTDVQAEVEAASRVSEADKMISENLAGEGWQLWRERKLAEAEKVFKKAVQKDATNANAWNGLGWSQLKQGKRLNAKHSFKKCLDVEPKHAAALNGLGWIAKGQGKTNEAIGHWEKAVEAAPTATAALNGLATTYMELEQYDKAVKYYEMWLNVEPDNADAKAGLQKAKVELRNVNLVSKEAKPADLQSLIDSARRGGTVIVPRGVYTEPIEINKSLTLKGQSRADCIFEVTADRPAIFVDTKGKGRVTIEGLTIKWRLATSNKNIEHPFAVAVKDTKAEVKNCSFLPLGNFKRSPVAVRAMGFSKVNINTCRFEGFGFAVFYNEGTEGAIQDSLIMNCQSQGITIFRGATVDIVGNIIAGSKKHAVRNTGGTLFMKDNLIIDNANRGIYLGNKSARGAISNNIIMNNGTGISGFAKSKVKIENNVIADSSYAGIGMRNSCSLLIRDNIFQGNERGWILFKEGSRGGNTVYRNTFWKNKVDAENFRKTANSIAAEPGFVDAANGDFSLKSGPAKEHNQGLTNPEVFKSLWKVWQNREDKNEPFISSDKSDSAIFMAKKRRQQR